MILLQINAVLRIGHWYRNHNYSDFFIGVIQSIEIIKELSFIISMIQSLSSLPKETQALGTRLEKQETQNPGYELSNLNESR